MKTKDIAALFLLASLWGASFLFIRIAAPVLGPITTMGIRVIVAGLALLIFALITKRELDFKNKYFKYIFIGGLNAALPFTLIAAATITLNASLASILNSTTPLFTALAAAWILNEKINFKKIIGIGLGILGVVVLLGWSPLPLTPEVIKAAFLSITAALAYALGGVYIKKNLKGIDSFSLATGQLLGAALLLMPLTIFRMPEGNISLTVYLSVLGLALFCTSFAYLIYFNLIESVGPTRTLSVTLLVPLFGVLWGFLFLNEKITGGVILGLMIILSSIYLISDMEIKFLNNKNSEEVK